MRHAILAFLLTFPFFVQAHEAVSLSSRFDTASGVVPAVLMDSSGRKGDERRELKKKLSPALLEKYPKIVEWTFSQDSKGALEVLVTQESWMTSKEDAKALQIPLGRNFLKHPEWFDREMPGGYKLKAQMFLAMAVKENPRSFNASEACKLLRPWLKDPHPSARGSALLALAQIQSQAMSIEDAGAMLEDHYPPNVGTAIEILTRFKADNPQYLNKIEAVALHFNDIRMPVRQQAVIYWGNVFPKDPRAVNILFKAASTPVYARFYEDMASFAALMTLKEWGFKKEYETAGKEYERLQKEYAERAKREDEDSRD